MPLLEALITFPVSRPGVTAVRQQIASEEPVALFGREKDGYDLGSTFENNVVSSSG
jgi:hypothetical protein